MPRRTRFAKLREMPSPPDATDGGAACSCCMDKPDQPDRPATGQFPDHGIPPEAADAQSKGSPVSDRGKSETAAARTEDKDG